MQHGWVRVAGKSGEVRMVNHKSLSSPRDHLKTENRGTDPMTCNVWVPNHSKYEKLGMFGHAREWILLTT